MQVKLLGLFPRPIAEAHPLDLPAHNGQKPGPVLLYLVINSHASNVASRSRMVEGWPEEGRNGKTSP